MYLIIRIQGLKVLLLDEVLHCLHVQLFYPVVEVPQPQDHTVRTEHKGHRLGRDFTHPTRRASEGRPLRPASWELGGH